MEVKTLGRPLAPKVDWEIFEGDVRALEVIGSGDASDLRIYDVSFAVGARTTWHTHTVDQVLYIVSGHGVVATEADVRAVRAGDLVVVPAGERHWHGATDETEMSHLAVMTEGQDEL